MKELNRQEELQKLYTIAVEQAEVGVALDIVDRLYPTLRLDHLEPRQEKLRELYDLAVEQKEIGVALDILEMIGSRVEGR